MFEVQNKKQNSSQNHQQNSSQHYQQGLLLSFAPNQSNQSYDKENVELIKIDNSALRA
jgi:hypothetical protein